MDIISSKNKLKNLSLPIFNNDELKKYGFDKKTIELKNMLKSNIPPIELFDKIYTKYNSVEYDLNHIVSFTINFQ